MASIYFQDIQNNLRFQNRSRKMFHETYIPTSFTLCTLESFGHGPTKASNKSLTNHHTKSEAKFIPDFLRIPRKAYDKQALLQQMRKQKLRTRQVTACNGQLKRNLSNSRLIKKPNSHAQFSKTECLKRQIQFLLDQITKQDQEIMKIKTSKKYNRYKELLSSKYVYQEQITLLKKKIKTCKYAISEQRRIYKQHRKREKDLKIMNEVIQKRLIQENEQLNQELHTIKRLERESYANNSIKQKERARLLREINDLQKLTGKIYIIECKESNEQGQEKQPPKQLSKIKQEPKRSNEKHQQPFHSQLKEETVYKYKESQESQDDSSECYQDQKYQEKPQKFSQAWQEEHRLNLSY